MDPSTFDPASVRHDRLSGSAVETQAQAASATQAGLGNDTRRTWTPGTPDELLGLCGAEHRVVREAIKGRLFAHDDASSSGARGQLDSTRIGRFVVLRRIGEGGMGVVFAAYDEELDRKIAIKLLRGRQRRDGRSRARLLREAQGLARLSHPNVVQVHEIGEHEGEIYVAMEFVPGQTLRQWLTSPRSWRDIVGVLLQAGAGLQAAHDKGLVHRDFKPDNVMVGEDGRARVLDFGLVRTLEPTPSQSGVEQTFEDERPITAAELRQPLTRTGATIGTPVYMAPEQHEGEAADALCDQFAFCVAAYEALFGRRPFPHASLIQLIEAIRTGAIRPVPRDSAVPRRIREAIFRGLAADRAARWPSLRELLLELERGLEGRSRAWSLAGAGVLGCVLAGGIMLTLPSAERAGAEVCAIEAAALTGVWDEPRRIAVGQAMGASGKTVLASLDAWSQDWLAAQRDACEATHVHRVQSSALLEQRQACLIGQSREVAGVVDVLARADARVLAKAESLLAGLPRVADCADPTGERTLGDPSQREQIATLEHELGEAKALLAAGKLDEADRLIAEITSASASVSHPALELRGRALALQSSWQRQPGSAAVDAWRALAGEARLSGFDALEAELRVGLATSVTTASVESPAAERRLIADAELSLAGRDERVGPRVLALQRARAQVLAHEGRLAEAELAYAELLAQVRGSELEAHVHHSLANIAAEQGQVEVAQREYVRARQLLVERWGPEHPGVLAVDANLATLAIELGHFEQAGELLDRVEAAHRDMFGAESLELARDWVLRARLSAATGELGRARELLESAARVVERELDPQGEEAARIAELLGTIRYFEGDYAGALAAYDGALAVYERELGPTHVQVAVVLGNRGDALLALDRPREALQAHERALALLQASLPAEHPSLALPLAGRGESWLALGQPELAVSDLERALLLDLGDPAELAETRFALARALTALDRDPERARELTEQARATFDELGLTARRETLDRWSAH